MPSLAHENLCDNLEHVLILLTKFMSVLLVPLLVSITDLVLRLPLVKPRFLQAITLCSQIPA